jgi:hypothetical protein
MLSRLAVRPAAVLPAAVVPAALLAAAAGLTATAAPAHAATVISPPTITAPLGGLGPYPTGTPVTFTFSETGAGTAVSYEYALNGGSTQTVAAPSGVAGVPVTPERQRSVLTVYAVAADGTASAGTVDIFTAFAATPAADHDLNGDGLPDLLTVGGTRGLAAGLWLATGKSGRKGATGSPAVSLPATDIGINGNGFSVPGSPADFTGAQAITGHFSADGFQDVLLYYPSGNDAGGGAVLAGSGDGSALQPDSGSECTIPSGGLTDFNGDNPLQVVNAYGSIYGTGLPDLLATSGDPGNGYYLDYYDAGSPCLYFNTFTVHTPTPDGTADWNQWTLATLGYAGGTGMFLWNESTGALYLWAGLTAADNGDGTGTLTYTQYRIAAHWHTGKPLATLEAADINGDGVPDLWTVTPAGAAQAYLVSHLSASGTAQIRAGKRQQLP